VSKNTNPLASLVKFVYLSLNLSIFLASCFLSWQGLLASLARSTRQFGECLEKFIHTLGQRAQICSQVQVPNFLPNPINSKTDALMQVKKKN
jgi:hypothetical protein